VSIHRNLSKTVIYLDFSLGCRNSRLRVNDAIECVVDDFPIGYWTFLIYEYQRKSRFTIMQ